MVYLLFAFSVFFIRCFAGYDSRYQKGKYICIKNSFVSKILLDSTSLLERTKRLKKDRNKISLCGIILYIETAVVLFINLSFFIIPDIPTAPWGVETEKFLLYTNTLNEKISAIAIFLLFLSVMGDMGIAIIETSKDTAPKWIKVLVRGVAIFMILIVLLTSIYLLCELFSCFL